MLYEIRLFCFCLLLDGHRRCDYMIGKVCFGRACKFNIPLKVRIFFIGFRTTFNLMQRLLDFGYLELSEELALVLCFEVFEEEVQISARN